MVMPTITESMKETTTLHCYTCSNLVIIYPLSLLRSTRMERARGRFPTVPSRMVMPLTMTRMMKKMKITRLEMGIRRRKLLVKKKKKKKKKKRRRRKMMKRFIFLSFVCNVLLYLVTVGTRRHTNSHLHYWICNILYFHICAVSVHLVLFGIFYFFTFCPFVIMWQITNMVLLLFHTVLFLDVFIFILWIWCHRH